MILLLLFLPLVSSLICGFLNKSLSNVQANRISCSLITIAAIIGIKNFIFFEHEHIILGEWFTISNLNVNWSIYVDQLSAIMFMTVTTVSAVVHIYSVQYMKDDENLPRFMSYLSLFTFFMLILVSADNFIQVFAGWEGVGLCSYLLIGFWYKKSSANLAAIKAFIVNRVADFAFLIAIIAIIYYCQSADFSDVFSKSEFLSEKMLAPGFSVLDLICLLLFIGCMGKSAQIGLHVWLPDAMEGPTPVSALIHAATMVTAGVFLVARCSYMFDLSPMVMNFMAFTGAVTCLFAATIAIKQNDIKKIIAYSTCSQLGYMFIACGSGACRAGIFHLVTHAFFKAMLFLCAGSVIHAVHEQDITKMGGLRRKLPYTYLMFWLGSLAIIGIFPFAGYYSKDMILEAAYENNSTLFYFGIIAAFFTACYSMKIICMVFHGKSHLTLDHAHESYTMLMPLSVLVAGTVCAGFIGVHYLNIGDINGYFSNSIVKNLHSPHELSSLIENMPLIVGIVGIVVGAFIYSYQNNVKNLKQNTNILHRFYKCMIKIVEQKYYFDEIYEIIAVKGIKFLSLISRIFDVSIVDRFIPGSAAYLVKKMSRATHVVQSGYIFNYALFMIMGVIVAITLSLLRFV